MKIQPLSDRVVVTATTTEQKSQSGIVIPDTAKEKPQEGEVVAVGSGRMHEETGKRLPMDVKVGDKVLFTKYGGDDFKIDGVEYKVLRQDEILGTVK